MWKSLRQALNDSAAYTPAFCNCVLRCWIFHVGTILKRKWMLKKLCIDKLMGQQVAYADVIANRVFSFVP